MNQSRESQLLEFSNKKPARFKYLTFFQISKKLLGWSSTTQIDMVLNEEFTHDSRRLSISFIKATDIKLGDFNPAVGCVVNIRDIADRQLEDVHFRVVEEEWKLFSFNCDDFEYHIGE